MVGQEREVLASLAQGRQLEREHVDAVVQVLPERAGRDRALEVAIGGGDDAHVDALIVVVADPAELLRLQHPQQLALQGR